MAFSQVALLLQRIDKEYWSADQALHGLAIVARHDFITTKMERVDALHQELVLCVGEKQAISLIIETLSSDHTQPSSQVGLEIYDDSLALNKERRTDYAKQHTQVSQGTNAPCI